MTKFRGEQNLSMSKLQHAEMFTNVPQQNSQA